MLQILIVKNYDSLEIEESGMWGNTNTRDTNIQTGSENVHLFRSINVEFVKKIQSKMPDGVDKLKHSATSNDLSRAAVFNRCTKRIS